MAAWYKADSGFRTHHKPLRVAAALGVHAAYARGLLAGLWSWAVAERPSGDLSGLDDFAIAVAADWPGEPAALVAALVAARLLDGEPGAYSIHGWAERMGSYAESARRSRSRRGVSPSCPPRVPGHEADVTLASASCPPHVRPCPGPEENRTEENLVSDHASHDPHPGSQASAGHGEPGQALALIATEPPPRTPPTGRASKAGASDAARASYADQAREVWAHYRERWHPRVAPELLPASHEYRAICDRLREGSTVRDLTDAIDGCHGDPWHQGANDKGAKYLSITLICRSASHVQRYRELLARPARIMSAHETQAMSAAQRFINGSGGNAY